MNIDTSGFDSYYRIQNLSDLLHDLKTERKKVKPGTVKTGDEFKVPEIEETSSREDLSSTKVELTSSLSKYLSPEEKKMLNILFPPAGRDFGIRAYKSGQKPVENKSLLGQRVDVRT